MEKKLRKELIKKGYVGKYTFDDIAGESSRIVETKTIAEKLARTDSAVLIQGESELFGYAEGAFAGAKKCGKTGLFEQASGGTIFLDEIGFGRGKKILSS